VIGEVDDAKLNAFTKQIDGEYVIQFNSGLIEFIYGISSILVRSVKLYLRVSRTLGKFASSSALIKTRDLGSQNLMAPANINGLKNPFFGSAIR